MRIVCHKVSTLSLIVLLASWKAFSQTSSAGSTGTEQLLPEPTIFLLFTKLAWEASPSPEVAGYAVYYRLSYLSFMNRVDAGAELTVTIPMLVGSPYTIYVVAYTAEGIESEPSNLLQYKPPALTPLRLFKLDDGGLQLRFRTSPLVLCRVEWTDDLTTPNWQPWVIVRADLNGDVVLTDPLVDSAPARFYRAARL